ncbi:unnamed protein product [Arabis nemorensis]|uniref:Carboxypeptidase n=1 Tax=Arabis nemorensis TaxID=586526 RepID=A0A565C657_9BRAS|nr:unnamed protein product [Arabis nemorensis]
MAQALLNFRVSPSFPIPKTLIQSHSLQSFNNPTINSRRYLLARPIRCAASSTLRTCKNCKTQFDPLLNHPRACRFHTAHFGGETKRKFESVYTGGTMDTPNSGQVLQYWHCCGSEDPFDSGCTASPHSTYDD